MLQAIKQSTNKVLIIFIWNFLFVVSSMNLFWKYGMYTKDIFY